jgi:drug/metabolite transporter (DMT)-like permease
MAFAMLAIPVSDGIVKLLSGHHPVLFLNWMRFLVGGLIFTPLALVFSRGIGYGKNELLPLIWRTALHVVAISLYFLAIARVPIADALGAYFVAPIVAVIFAAWYLRESISRLQVAAVLIGFMGAMIVVRPGASMNIGMVYAVLSGFVFGLFLVLTRKAGQTVAPITTLGIQCIVGTFFLLPIAIYSWTPLSWSDAALIFTAGIIWSLGHLAIVKAFSLAPTSVLAPIVYLEIAGGAGIGYVLFGDLPGVGTMVGILLIVLAGLLVRFGKGPSSDKVDAG